MRLYFRDAHTAEKRIGPLLFVLAAVSCGGLTGCGGDDERTQATASSLEPSFVGATVCSGCHTEQAELWRGSHHALAMQPANEATVLGAFDDIEFIHNGVTSRFYRRGGEYFVETDGPDGQLGEFPVRYTFGVEPLQQYLVELPGGRIQVLGATWDSRPVEQGGQRWFHVYGDEVIDHNDVLHWTRPAQNWDSMCAYCHSTDLQKSFDLQAKTFDTTWAEMNVACEACHGPGSRHVEWASVADGKQNEEQNGDKGFAVHFDERDGASWIPDPETGNSRRSRPRTTQVEINACAACHSRRSQIDSRPQPGDELLDTFRPALISMPMYHVDGQISDEVYVYGSFLQSRMHQQGVTCSDCHEPHSLKLREPGAQVCLTCHAAGTYAVTGHHLHPEGSAGADCVECHMPPTTYMQVDPRHDHSFRIPRPDLAVAFGTPDACTNCHDDKSAAWAADVLRKNGRVPDENHWQVKFSRIMSGQVGDRESIAGFSADPSVPAIIRASVIEQAGQLGDAQLTGLLAAQAGSADPLIRWAVAQTLQYAPEPVILRHAPPLLEDPDRAVRIEAANALAAVALELLPAHSQNILQSVLDESLVAEQVNNERAEAHTNIGNLQRKLGRPDRSESAYRTALELNPFFVPAYVNLADLYRAQEREDAGEALLREALVGLPGQPALHYSLGLSLYRQGRAADAREELWLAAEAEEAEPSMALAYALLLDAQGETETAIEYLAVSRQRFGDDPALLSALISMYQRTNRQDDAETLIRQLQNP